MRPVYAIGFLLLACAPEEPTFGPPGAAKNAKLPNETTPAGGATNPGGGLFPAAYDANANKPPKSMKEYHAAAGGPAPPNVPACYTCHTGAAAPAGDAGTATGAASKPLAFGGQVVETGTTTGVADCDVIVVGTATTGPQKTDADGYFWFAGPPITAGSTGVRKGTKEQKMNGPLTANGGNCEQAGCHVAGGNPGKVQL